MKQFYFLLIFSLISFIVSAQDFTGLKDVELKTEAECRSYDSTALQCANYIINTPVNDNLNRVNAMSFLIKWMSATPDYGFTVKGNITKLGNKNDFLVGVYMACMTKYSMENKDNAADENQVTLNAYHMLAVYCNNDANNIKLDKDLRKLIEADKNGTLEKYLNIQ